MEIYRRIYDNPLNPDGTARENELFGEFELLDGSMSDYEYQVPVRSLADGTVYLLTGIEVTGIGGGTRHSLQPIREHQVVEWYRKFC